MKKNIYILKRKTKLTPKENQSTFLNQFTLAVIYSAVFNIYHSIFFSPKKTWQGDMHVYLLT